MQHDLTVDGTKVYLSMMVLIVAYRGLHKKGHPNGFAIF